MSANRRREHIEVIAVEARERRRLVQLSQEVLPSPVGEVVDDLVEGRLCRSVRLGRLRPIGACSISSSGSCAFT